MLYPKYHYRGKRAKKRNERKQGGAPAPERQEGNARRRGEFIKQPGQCGGAAAANANTERQRLNQANKPVQKEEVIAD